MGNYDSIKEDFKRAKKSNKFMESKNLLLVIGSFIIGYCLGNKG